MRAIIVDDEQPAIDELNFLLENYEAIEVLSSFNEPKKALAYILLNEVDVIFLDISMPEMDGFALAEVLIRLRKPPAIVFVTAYDEYAIKAFDVNAIDYLLKPVTYDRLDKAVLKLSQLEKQVEPISNLLKERYIEQRAKRLPLWKNDRIHLISPKDIAFIEASDGETTIHTSKGTFVSNESLNHYEDILTTYGFFRCHRSYLIHLECIKEIVPWFNNTYIVKLQGYDSQDVPVSRRNIKDFKTLLQL